jgi:hypothetical protein
MNTADAISFRDTIKQIRKILQKNKGHFVRYMDIDQFLVEIEGSFYNEGYDDGYRAGYKKGYADGEESKE